jgi:predicted benzoate:H+ symporter BenE
MNTHMKRAYTALAVTAVFGAATQHLFRNEKYRKGALTFMVTCAAAGLAGGELGLAATFREA